VVVGVKHVGVGRRVEVVVAVSARVVEAVVVVVYEEDAYLEGMEDKGITLE
jgi:hypothetical protein